ncbi:RbsD/FucU family protein (plasmid) [Rhizobium leguminosarum]|jgi:L-fucose mutarotase|uniref:Fucose binding protein n=4 Tax=Rhizobium TaxID=379 RepID=A0A1B8R9G2_RHILT|nr:MULTISPECIES: RbsD/FucU domain-containing protein [Rhizobium]MDH6660277.1 L-fucose mutarotase [Rhizobium sophorae]AOO91753.1 fucose binding protein [Rhizobium leguminosarum bv. trifolii]ASS58517.1 fucose-binding protein [Rhizobium leguminosarum bv. viciae]AXA42651.1 RbsD / FucU transport family protein [Rhizobium leguminosarum]MBB4332344.1 L-fucose mutarotase [Rhizobium leguminosarum]
MLRGIDPVLNAELMHALMLMGHGDQLVLCDVNHPAQTIARHTTYGHLIDVSGCGLERVAEAILTLFPLDTFIDAPVKRMQVVGDASGQMPIFATIQKVIDRAEDRPVRMEALERFAFYEAAKKSFAIVRTSDPGPYGCFIFSKGVI